MYIYILIICMYQGGCNMAEMGNKDACERAITAFHDHYKDLSNGGTAYCVAKD